MGRLYKYFLFAVAFAIATFTTTNSYAQTSQPTSTPSPSPTRTVVSAATRTPRATELAAEAANTTQEDEDADPTATATPPTLSPLLPTPTPSVSITSALASPLTSTIVTAVNNGPLEGTILANRSETVAQFFLEGSTYRLEAGHSQGIKLPRATTVLNLFNCDGDLATDTPGCFWDPYLLQQDGFYEIYNAEAAGEEAKLMLREAGAPPTGQVWVQNRTGQVESVVFKDDVYEIQPTAVLEFPVATGVPAILYVRSCLTVDNQSACEWAPKTLNAGVYYSMVEVDTPGTQSGSTRSTIDLRPIMGESEVAEAGSSAPVATSAPSPAGILCNVVVPALNIRSGPGLQYDIIGKVRTTDGSAGTVNVTGRSADEQWLTVDPTVAENGWINNSPSFITCTGDLAGLPIVDAPAAPTPSPIVVDATPTTTVPGETAPDVSEPVAEEPAATDEPTEVVEVTATPEGVTIPAGQAVLVVNNGFQHEMRFTLDQMYRPQTGPSEFDLQPGQSIAIVVFPGDIPFSASSPWSGLSANANVHVDADQSLTLWLRFEPEQGDNWVFRFN